MYRLQRRSLLVPLELFQWFVHWICKFFVFNSKFRFKISPIALADCFLKIIKMLKFKCFESPNFESKKDFLKIELRNLKSSSLKGFIERQWSATWFAGHRGRCLRLFASVHKCSRVTCEVKSLERPSVVRLLIVRLTTGLIIRTWMHSGHRSVGSVWLSVWFSVWLFVWLSVWFFLYDSLCDCGRLKIINHVGESGPRSYWNQRNQLEADWENKRRLI